MFDDFQGELELSLGYLLGVLDSLNQHFAHFTQVYT